MAFNDENRLPDQPETTPDSLGQLPPLDLDDLNVDALLASFRQDTEADANLPLELPHPEEESPALPQPSESSPEEPSQQPESEVQPSQPRQEAAPEDATDIPLVDESSASNVKAEEYLIDTAAYIGMDGATPRKRRRKRHPHFFYYIAEAFRGIVTHSFMSFAAVSIITACLIIMGTFSLIALNVDSQIQTLMDKNEFLAYVNEDYTTEQAQALQSLIESVENVSQVTFITRQEAYENYIADMQDTALYADLDPDSVFRDRYSVQVTNLEEIEATSQLVEAIDGIDSISIDVDLANNFVTLRNIVLLVAAVLVGILFIISLFIISNTIKLVSISRQEEISIMRMVGATSRFIRWPFIYQGAILGLLGSGIAYGLQSALYIGINNAIQGTGQSSFNFALISFYDISMVMLAVFLASGLLIGVIGSSMAIRKFLKK